MAEYTILLIWLLNGSFIIELTIIIEAIKAIFPKLSVHLDVPVLNKVMAILNASITMLLVPFPLLRILYKCLFSMSIAYYI